MKTMSVRLCVVLSLLAVQRASAEDSAQEAPFTLEFATYLGGSGGENFRDIAVDGEGNIYVAGGTSSADFPTTPGAFDRTFHTGGADLGTGGPMDVFVAKLSPAGELIWATYVGGPNYDRAYAIEIAPDGSVVIAGRAGPGFPTTPGVRQPDFGGDLTAGSSAAYGKQDGFVAKLAPDGSHLIWATYFGGPDSAIIRDVDVGPDGDCYVVSPGNTHASHPHVAGNVYDVTHNGGQDVVVARIDAFGSHVLWGTYLGGSGDDGGGPSIRVDPRTGEVVVVGNTSSANFPTPNGWDRTYGGGSAATGDAFLAKLTPDGSDLVFATYLGGSSDEGCGTHNLAIGPHGEIVVAHWTKSGNIPILPGGFQTAHHGQTDAIVWRFSPSGELLANTYLGGNGGENVQGTAIDRDGNIYLSIDASTSTDFPVTPTAFQLANAGGSDGAFAVLPPDLTTVLYATYLGGRGNDGSREAALDRYGNYVCAGDTASKDFPLLNAYDSTLGGSTDGFIARFSPDPVLLPPPQGQSFLFDFGAADSITSHGPDPNDPLNYWNNVTEDLGGSADGQLPEVVNTRGEPTTITLQMLSPFNGSVRSRWGTPKSTIFPDKATRDSLFSTESPEMFASFKLTGLDRRRSYNVTFYASVAPVVDDRAGRPGYLEANYTAAGENQGSVLYDPVNNWYNRVGFVTGIVPDALGEITISLAATDRNNHHSIYLGVMQVDELPDPQPAASAE